MDEILDWFIDAIPSFIKSRICSKEELRQKHLADIKKEVFEPMLNNLDETYIPVLKSEKHVVNISKKYAVIKGRKATEDAGKYERKLAKPALKSNVNNTLYLDIKKNHYKGFIKEFEEFVTDFENYTDAWLTYATEIQNTIAKESELPLYDGNTDVYFIDAPFLAAYTIERITGLNPTKMWMDESPPPPTSFIFVNSILDQSGTSLVLKGNQENAKKCEAVVNSILTNEIKSKELNQSAKTLLERATKLRNAIDTVIKTYKLDGKCEHV